VYLDQKNNGNRLPITAKCHFSSKQNADAYLLKPVDVEKLLNTVKQQLEAQENERKFSEQKVAEFIESRVKELSPNSF